jgi:hypothetical protein
MKRMQKNDMTGVGTHHVKWDEDFLEKVFAETCQCISVVTGYQKVLVRFRVIAESLPANEQIPGDTEPKTFGETRYVYKKDGETRYGSYLRNSFTYTQTWSRGRVWMTHYVIYYCGT